MGIQQDQAIDLKQPQIFRWASDEADQSMFASPDPPLKAGFVKVVEKVMGASLAQSYSWGVHEVWSVQDLNHQHISTFEICVPRSQRLAIETVSVVAVADTASQAARDALLQRFDSYDPGSGIDPLEWARTALPPDEPLGFGLFDVRQKYALRKVGAIWEDRSALSAIRRRIEQGGVADGPRKFYCVQISAVPVAEMPEAPSLPEERILPGGVDPQDPATADHEIGQIVASAAHPEECMALQLQPWKHKVGDLLTYPEFKIEWELVHVRIGCVEVALHLPVLYTRNSTKQLWVFSFFPDDPLAVLGKIVESCALLGAGAGVVAGLVFSNLAAAIAAFKHVFLECFKNKVGTTIKCVLPGLALLTATETWRKV